nr:MAG TPA: hypothetical protein [Bacteriophage sp.]
MLMCQGFREIGCRPSHIFMQNISSYHKIQKIKLCLKA